MKYIIDLYKSLTIVQKFLIPALLSIVFFVYFSVHIYIKSNTMQEKIHNINIEYFPMYENITTNERLLDNISNELYSAVLSKESEWIDHTQKDVKKFYNNLKEIQSDKYQDRLDRLTESFDGYFTLAVEVTNSLIVQENSYLDENTQELVKHFNRVQNELKDLKYDIKDTINHKILKIYGDSNSLVLVSSFIFFIWMVIFLAVIIFIYNDLKVRIKTIVEDSKEIASGEARFSKRLHYNSSDEIGVVANSINLFIDKLEQNHLELIETKNTTKKFILDTVHQIGAPISTLNIASQTYKMTGDMKLFSQMSEEINASVNMLSNSYEDLSYVTSNDTIEYNPAMIPISELVKQRVKFFDIIAQVNKHEIEYAIDNDLYVYINNVELERIIDNNISNAIKYALDESDIEVTLKSDDDCVILSIASYGAKIENSERIFEKNYRNHNKQRGLGWGLNMVKNICEKNNVIYSLEHEDGRNIFIYRLKKEK